MNGQGARKRKNANSDQISELETATSSQEQNFSNLTAVQNQMAEIRIHPLTSSQNSVSESEDKEDKSSGAKKRRTSNRYKRKPKFLNEAVPTIANTPAPENENEEEVEAEKKDDEFDPEEDDKPKQVDDPSKPKKQYQRKPRRRLVTRRIGGKLPQETVRALRTVEWRELDFVGLEIKGVKEIKQEPFEFPDLIQELMSGVLANVNPVYLFMGAQPITVGETVKNIPYIVAIDCRKPPSGRVAVTSIQSGTEVIEPISRWHLSWIPYMPRKFAYATADTPAQIQVLAWEERRSKLSRYNEEKVHKVSLLLPYELLPHMFEAEPLEKRLELVKSVDFQFKAENGHTFGIVWDKDAHKLSVDVDVLIEDEKLPETEKPRIKAALKEEFEKARQKVRDKYNREKTELEALKPEDLKALKDIKLYKFYPTHPSLDIKPHIVPLINRYYGKAHKVFPDLPDLKDGKEKEKEPQKVDQFSAPSVVDTNSNSSGFVFQTSAPKPTSINNFMLPSNNTFAPPTFNPPTFNPPASTSGFSLPAFTAPSTGFSVPSTGFSIPTSGFALPTASAPVSSQTTGFVFTGPVSTSSSESADAWTCAACEAKNPLSTKTCNVCMLPRRA